MGQEAPYAPYSFLQLPTATLQLLKASYSSPQLSYLSKLHFSVGTAKVQKAATYFSAEMNKSNLGLKFAL